MAYELSAISVTSGLVIELGKIFPYTRYREVVPAQRIEYPHFFVNQLTVSATTERRNHWIIEYLANIRYHVAADPASVSGSLQQRLDDVSIKLLSELDYIYWDGIPVRIKNPRTEKVDGVLHHFCNISVMANKPVEHDPLQGQFETIIKLS